MTKILKLKNKKNKIESIFNGLELYKKLTLRLAFFFNLSQITEDVAVNSPKIKN